jgi:hypothetical protein
MNNELIICYLKPLSENEIISINKYWTLNDGSKDEFKYTLQHIDSQRDPACGRVSNLVNKSFCLVHYPSFFCKECKLATPVRCRFEFTERLNINSFICKNCREKEQKTQYEYSIIIVQNFLDKLLNKTDYFSDLGYIDKLILLSFLLDDYQERKPVFTNNTRINITGSENVDLSALSRLITLGALVNITELPDDVKQAETIIYESSASTSSKKRQYKPKTQQKYYAIERGIYFSLSLGFNNLSEFIEKIYDDVVHGGIGIKEITGLKQMINDMRVENYYRLIEHISMEFKLEISNSVPLSALLSHLSEKYPLTKAYYMFHRLAKEVILFIHRSEPLGYTKSHLFTKFVSNYIKNIEENEWELKYTRQLPESIFTSNIEALISRNFLEEHFNWHGLSTTEVIAIWLSKIKIHESSAYLPQS